MLTLTVQYAIIEMIYETMETTMQPMKIEAPIMTGLE